MINKLEKSIISTLAYANTKAWPMSLWEIYRYLVSPKRLDGENSKLDSSFFGVEKSVLGLLEKNIIEEENGFFFLKSTRLINKRIERDKISDLKNKKALKKLYFLAHFPFIRGVFLSGSLAFGWAKEESDVDVFIVTKHGKIWTARFIVSLVLLLIGLKRTKNEVQNKICLNHFISENNLMVPLYSMYTAKLYTRIIPIYASPGLVKNFIKNNNWVRDYVLHGFGDYYCDSRTKHKSFLLRLVQILLENLILIIGLGSILEKALKYFQSKRIKKDPLTYKKGGRVVFSDTQIELHPESPEVEMINQYNKTLKKLNLFSFKPEQDSGLRR